MHYIMSHPPAACAYWDTVQARADSTLRDMSTGGFLRCSAFLVFILFPSLSSFPSVFLSFLVSVPVEADMNGDKEPDGSRAMNPD